MNINANTLCGAHCLDAVLVAKIKDRLDPDVVTISFNGVESISPTFEVLVRSKKACAEMQ